jgi:uncharacterized protein YpiB (UPF0302 family)
MFSEEQLKDYIRSEKSSEKQHVYYMMYKFFKLLSPYDPNNQPQTTLYIKNRKFLLSYWSEEEQLDSLFHDDIEILTVLQQLFTQNESVQIYIQPSLQVQNDSIETLLQLIDKALLNNDKEAFFAFTEQLRSIK